MADLIFNQEEVSSNTYRFSSSYEGKIYSNITIALLEKNQPEFDFQISIEGVLGAIADLSQKDFTNIENAKNLKERIQLFKEFNYYTTQELKRLIYAAEIAYKIYLKEQTEMNLLNFNLKIKSSRRSMGMSDEVLLFTVINGIWSLLEFTPKKELKVKIRKKSYKTVNEVYKYYVFETIIPYSVTTEFVKRDKAIDESLTEIHKGFDDEKFEKGREYQWLV